MRREFTAGADDDDRRLESVLRKLLPQQPLAALHKAVRRGDVRLNGLKAAADSRVRAGDVVAVWEALVEGSGPPPPPRAAPVPASWILYSDDDFLVLDKPSGLLVHRGDGAWGSETPLDERVRAGLGESSAPSLSFRPGPLHRLDRETSGLVVFSKTLTGARSFSHALASRQVSKTYLALLRGELRESVESTQPLLRTSGARSVVSEDGQDANTRFVPLASSGGLTLAEVALGTGRTHQIRVHAQALGLPLAGDAKYGGGSAPAGLPVPWLLHAWKLSCPLFPALTAPLPAASRAWIEKLFKISP